MLSNVIQCDQRDWAQSVKNGGKCTAASYFLSRHSPKQLTPLPTILEIVSLPRRVPWVFGRCWGCRGCPATVARTCPGRECSLWRQTVRCRRPIHVRSICWPRPAAIARRDCCGAGGAGLGRASRICWRQSAESLSGNALQQALAGGPAVSCRLSGPWAGEPCVRHWNIDVRRDAGLVLPRCVDIAHHGLPP